MKTYKIYWTAIIGESYVDASSRKEAREKAEKGEDKGSEPLEADAIDSEISRIDELKDY